MFSGLLIFCVLTSHISEPPLICYDENKKEVIINPYIDLDKQLNNENCFYVIGDVIDLKGETIICPNNIRLGFRGGKLKNGVIKGAQTSVDGDACFESSIILLGSWVEPKIEWYDIDREGKNPVDKEFNTILSLSDSIVIPSGRYLLNKGLTIERPCKIDGCGSILLSSTTDAPAAFSIDANNVKISNLSIECNNKAKIYHGRIHGLIVAGDNFYGSNITVVNANQNGFDIRGAGCVLEKCKSINPGYAGFRTINVLKKRMKKEEACCTLYDCQSIGYKRKGFVNNGGMGVLIIKGFTAIPLNDHSEAAILLESNENSHNYEVYISDVEALGIPGNVIKQKAFKKAVYANCNLESKYGAVFRFHPHRNKKNGERNAYIEISNCKLKGCTYCINGNADVQSLETQDTLYVHNSELIQSSGNAIIDVIKNVVIISKSTLDLPEENSKAVIIRSPHVTNVRVENSTISTTKVFGYSVKGQNRFEDGIFQLINTAYSGKLFGIRRYDSLVKVIED